MMTKIDSDTTKKCLLCMKMRMRDIYERYIRIKRERERRRRNVRKKH